MLRGWGAYTTPVVAADGGRYSIEGHVRRYFGIIKGAEAIGIRKVWRDGRVDGLGYT